MTKCEKILRILIPDKLEEDSEGAMAKAAAWLDKLMSHNRKLGGIGRKFRSQMIRSLV